MTTLAGSIDRIVFSNPDTGFVVARFHVADESRDPLTTIVGTLPSVRPGEMLRLTGEWQTHPVHGRNFRVELFEQEMPDTVDGIERFLASGAIEGIGPVTASRIVERFGEGTLEVIDQQPDLLSEVAGIRTKRLQIIKASWEERKKVRGLMMFLQEHGISVALAGRIYETYGDEAVSVIQRDPYQLAHDIHGIGFRTADAVAGRLGISMQSPSRYVAGLKYVLSRATEDGHVFLERPALLSRAAQLLEAPPPHLEPALLDLLQRGDAVLEDDAVYLAPFFTAEAGAARFLDRLRDTPSALTLDRTFDPVAAVRTAGEAQGLILAARQIEAAEQALRAKVSILTGGPGTGKTSTLRTIITALEGAGVTFALCAPTGRAAKRVAETTGRAASTIHRLLQFQPRLSIFAHDQSNPLPVDFVIVDEVSMLDTLLFYHLLKAISPEAHLLLVGDADQLPAVGPGNVLRDLMSSGVIPTITLTELFRQARGSQIVLAAHAINEGRTPDIDNHEGSDLYFIRGEDPEKLVESIRRLLRDRIPSRFGLDPVEDVQVISPMHAGPVGVAALNVELQALLNPPGPLELRRGDRHFRLGDKVMQIRNNYDKDVYNGDVGRVTGIDPAEGVMTVTFPTAVGSSQIEYAGAELDELVLAYAVSVHKAQGSEFPAVIMPLVPKHYMLLQRNLLYTAVTRARHLCVLVGSPRALQIAISNARGENRNTRLAARLHHRFSALQLDL